MDMKSRSGTRFLLMAPALLALLAALWAGLVRLGWTLPAWHPTLTLAHGPLIVSGFLGTLISLERAVALQRRWAYVAPALTGLGGLALIAGFPAPAGPALITLGSLGLVAVFGHIIHRHPAPFTVTLGLGALAWFVSNGLWLAGGPIYTLAPWWIGFLVLTIAGERLELARILRPSGTARSAFLATAGLLLIGCVLTTVLFSTAWRVMGVGMILLGVWLFRHDVARRTVRQSGLTRFIAVCLLSGYAWLSVSGALALVFGGVVAGPRYDAVLHSVFLGFVVAMIFGHAPIILPALTGRSLPFRSSFYAHLGLLHASLGLRVIGDLAGWWPARQWGGLLNVVALLLFLVTTVLAVRRSAADFG